MKIVNELIKNYKATYLLKKRYYNITSVVGSISAVTGLTIMMILFFYVGPIFGFDPDAYHPTNGAEKIAIFIIVMIFLITCLYMGMLLIAGSFAYVMYKLGKFTKGEAINYALYSGYPECWFEK